MLPTNIGVLFKNKDTFKDILENQYWEEAIICFQRATYTEDFEIVMRLMEPWFDNEPSENQMKRFKNLYELTKLEVKGNLIQMVADVYKDTGTTSSTKLEAVKLLDALLEGKVAIDEEGAAKLIIKLADTKDD